MAQTAILAAAAFFLLLLDRLFSWLPPGISVCVWAVTAAFLFSIMLKIISTILRFIFAFVDLIKP